MLLFATPCMGRLAHLRLTLPHNLAVLRPFAGRAGLLVLDYGCPQGSGAWAAESAAPTDSLVVYQTRSPKHYCHAHAKNACAQLAARHGAASVCNLDADNFLSPGYVERLLLSVEREPLRLVRSPRSAAGRIACSMKQFFDAGGYDERMRGWGAEDCDFAARVLSLPGAGYAAIEDTAAPVPHTNEERMAFMGGGSPNDSARLNGELYRQNRTGGWLRDPNIGYLPDATLLPLKGPSL